MCAEEYSAKHSAVEKNSNTNTKYSGDEFKYGIQNTVKKKTGADRCAQFTTALGWRTREQERRNENYIGRPRGGCI